MTKLYHGAGPESQTHPGDVSLQWTDGGRWSQTWTACSCTKASYWPIAQAKVSSEKWTAGVSRLPTVIAVPHRYRE